MLRSTCAFHVTTPKVWCYLGFVNSNIIKQSSTRKAHVKLLYCRMWLLQHVTSELKLTETWGLLLCQWGICTYCHVHMMHASTMLSLLSTTGCLDTIDISYKTIILSNMHGSACWLLVCDPCECHGITTKHDQLLSKYLQYLVWFCSILFQYAGYDRVQIFCN